MEGQTISTMWLWVFICVCECASVSLCICLERVLVEGWRRPNSVWLLFDALITQNLSFLWNDCREDGLKYYSKWLMGCGVGLSCHINHPKIYTRMFFCIMSLMSKYCGSIRLIFLLLFVLIIPLFSLCRPDKSSKWYCTLSLIKHILCMS